MVDPRAVEREALCSEITTRELGLISPLEPGGGLNGYLAFSH